VTFVNAAHGGLVAGDDFGVVGTGEVLQHGRDHAAPVAAGGTVNHHATGGSGHRLEDGGQPVREQAGIGGIVRGIVEVRIAEGLELKVVRILRGRVDDVERGERPAHVRIAGPGPAFGGVSEVDDGADAVPVSLLPAGLGDPFPPPHPVDGASHEPGVHCPVPADLSARVHAAS
jgi:hypothetical protein